MARLLPKDLGDAVQMRPLLGSRRALHGHITSEGMLRASSFKGLPKRNEPFLSAFSPGVSGVARLKPRNRPQTA